jgi:hypothetical protein
VKEKKNFDTPMLYCAKVLAIEARRQRRNAMKPETRK